MYSDYILIITMGKNFNGGNKQKSKANHASRNYDDEVFREPADQFEKVAVVTKVLGGGTFQTTFFDDNSQPVQSLAFIRGRMKGSAKRHNIVSLHSFIIISLRNDFSNHLNQSDIIHVFSQHHFYHIYQSFPFDQILDF